MSASCCNPNRRPTERPGRSQRVLITRGRAATPHRRRSAPAAFTLLELLIVVALLSLILAVTAPALRQLSGKTALRDAARQLRVSLLEARLAAIDPGSPQCFRYQPGTARYEVGPEPPLTAGLAARALPAGGLERDDAATRPPTTTSAELPRGMRFAEVTGLEGSPSAAAPVDPSSSDAPSVSILFSANGRAQNARIRLVNEPYRVELQLRGLTGTVQICPVERLPREVRP